MRRFFGDKFPISKIRHYVISSLFAISLQNQGSIANVKHYRLSFDKNAQGQVEKFETIF